MISYVFQKDGRNYVVVQYESGYRRTFEVDGMYYPTYHFPKTVERFLENADHVHNDVYGYDVWTRKVEDLKAA